MNHILPIYAVSALIQVIVLGLGAWWAPVLSRPELFFSVTVEANFRDSEIGHAILHVFRRWVAAFASLGAVLVMPLFFAWMSTALFVCLLSASNIVQLVGVVWAYASAHKSARSYGVTPSMAREAVLRPHETFSVRLRLLQFGPFFLLGTAGVCLWLNWDRLPETFPIHWGLDGKANSWAAKSPASVFALPMVGALVCGLLSFLNSSLSRNVRRVHASGSQGANESRNLQNTLGVVVLIQYLIAILFGFISVLPFLRGVNKPFANAQMLTAVSMVFPLVIVTVVSFFALKSGQGGWLLSSQQTAPHARPVGDRTPDSCWKAGIFYYNPDDPALWVEKRFGFGWTLNMANSRAWVISGTILVFGLGSPLLCWWLIK